MSWLSLRSSAFVIRGQRRNLGTGVFARHGRLGMSSPPFGRSEPLDSPPDGVVRSKVHFIRCTSVPRCSAGYPKNCAPFAEIVDPLMKLASSEARKVTQRAISSGSPRRPAGICAIIDSLTFSGTAITISVAM